MTIAQCHTYVESAVNCLVEQVNAEAFGEFNEATLQHHLAMNINLDAIREGQPSISMTLEKKVRRVGGQQFPKKKSKTASIDVFFAQQDDGVRCAIEMKCFRKTNNKTSQNRYDAYADLKNLEVYLDEHAEVGYLILFTNHRHYFDPEFQQHTHKTGDFSLRPNHVYQAGTELRYKTAKPHGPPITLENDYEFTWRNHKRDWRVLVVQVAGN